MARGLRGLYCLFLVYPYGKIVMWGFELFWLPDDEKYLSGRQVLV